MPIPMDSSSSSRSNNNNKDILDSEASHHDRSHCCFQEWMQTQRQDLIHLVQSLRKSNHHHNDQENKTLIRDCIANFQNYISTRRRLAQEDPSPFFAPTWCTSLENSLLWLGGCRPSIFTRLLYALSRCEADEWLEGLRNLPLQVHVGDLSPSQMTRVNELRIRTIRAEEKLTSEMASSQEELADQPIAVIANEMEVIGEVNEEAEMALTEQEKVKREIMDKADALRLNTLKEVMEILEPVQAMEFLAASKKLHLSLHQWGKRRDEKNGRKY